MNARLKKPALCRSGIIDSHLSIGFILLFRPCTQQQIISKTGQKMRSLPLLPCTDAPSGGTNPSPDTMLAG